MILIGDYMEKTEAVVVADAGPIIHLDEFGVLAFWQTLKRFLYQIPYGMK